MNKHFSLIIYALIIAFILLSGCHKPDGPTPPDPRCCKVTEMKDQNMTITFLYDAHGRLSYKWVSWSNHQEPTTKFIYDQHGKLSQFITTTSDDFNVGSYFWGWHRVTLDSKGRIATDTIVGPGEIGPNGPVLDPHVPANYYTESQFFEYDAMNRLVKEHSKMYGSASESVLTYTYDAQGNLPGPIIRDNMVNFMRTDPLLQFVNRDYSAHNQRVALRYNRYGLPLEYSLSDTMIIINQLDWYNLQIKYNCK